MNLDYAKIKAAEILNTIRPLCLTASDGYSLCQVAGSVRREKPDDIKDIEIVAVPAPIHMSYLKDIVNNLWGTPQIGAFPSKYTKIRAVLNIDFFWCTVETFGLNFFIRTGSREWGQKALEHWKKLTNGGYSQGAQLHRADGTIVPTPREEDVFTALQVRFVPPNRRYPKR